MPPTCSGTAGGGGCAQPANASRPAPEHVAIKRFILPLLDGCRLERAGAGSVLRLVHQRVLGDPRHHAAQPLADLLNRVLAHPPPRGLEARLVDAVLQHPVAGEASALDIGQHAAHLGLGLVGDDARAGDVLAVFGGVADRVVHIGDAALVNEVDDQLHFVQALEIGHLGGVAGLDQRLEPPLDQLDEAAAEHHLLAEQVGLALLLEGGLDDARASAADGAGVAERDLERVAARVLGHGHQARDAAAPLILAAHGVAGAFGGDHEHVDVGARVEQVEVHVQAVGEGEGAAGLHVRAELVAVEVALALVGGQDHDDVGPFRRIARVHDLQVRAFSLGHASGIWAQADREFGRAAIFEIVGVSMSLAAVADDRNLLALDQVHVGIAVVVHAHQAFPYNCERRLLQQASAAGDGGDAGAADFLQPDRAHQRDEGVQLVGAAGQLEHETLGGGVDHARPERVRQPQRLRPVRPGADDFDHRQLPRQMRSLPAQIRQAMHWHQAVELGLDLLDHHLGSGSDDVDAAARAGFVHRGHGEAVDVVAPAGEQPDDAGQDASLVLHQDRDGRRALRQVRQASSPRW